MSSGSARITASVARMGKFESRTDRSETVLHPTDPITSHATALGSPFKCSNFQPSQSAHCWVYAASAANFGRAEIDEGGGVVGGPHRLLALQQEVHILRIELFRKLLAQGGKRVPVPARGGRGSSPACNDNIRDMPTAVAAYSSLLPRNTVMQSCARGITSGCRADLQARRAAAAKSVCEARWPRCRRDRSISAIFAAGSSASRPVGRAGRSRTSCRRRYAPRPATRLDFSLWKTSQAIRAMDGGGFMNAGLSRNEDFPRF